MAIPEDFLTSVAGENLKVLAGVPSYAMGSQLLQHGAHMGALNLARERQITDASIASNTANMTQLTKAREVGAIESVATQKVLTGNDLGSQLGALAAVVGFGQIFTKGAQSTPPETARTV